MITLRQIERTWTANKFQNLLADLLVARTENSPRLRSLLSGSLAAAAMGLIRLEELNQSHAPLAGKFLRRILCSQSADGGWDDPVVTGALPSSSAHLARAREAINRGIAHLASLQKTDGAWPATPIRRLEADAFTSAFILFSIGGSELFQNAIRLDDAIAWFERHARSLDDSTSRLWQIVSRKLNLAIARNRAAAIADRQLMLSSTSN